MLDTTIFMVPLSLHGYCGSLCDSSVFVYICTFLCFSSLLNFTSYYLSVTVDSTDYKQSVIND